MKVVANQTKDAANQSNRHFNDAFVQTTKSVMCWQYDPNDVEDDLSLLVSNKKLKNELDQLRKETKDAHDQLVFKAKKHKTEAKEMRK